MVCVTDQREDDKYRNVKEQVRISIMLSSDHLLRKSAKMLSFGCDGTFGVVLTTEKYLRFELTTIVAKMRRLGNSMQLLVNLILGRQGLLERIYFFISFETYGHVLGYECL